MVCFGGSTYLLIKILHFKLLLIGKQLPTFPQRVGSGFKPLTSGLGGECINYYTTESPSSYVKCHLYYCDMSITMETGQVPSQICSTVSVSFRYPSSLAKVSSFFKSI